MPLVLSSFGIQDWINVQGMRWVSLFNYLYYITGINSVGKRDNHIIIIILFENWKWVVSRGSLIVIHRMDWALGTLVQEVGWSYDHHIILTIDLLVNFLLHLHFCGSTYLESRLPSRGKIPLNFTGSHVTNGTDSPPPLKYAKEN